MWLPLTLGCVAPSGYGQVIGRDVPAEIDLPDPAHSDLAAVDTHATPTLLEPRDLIALSETFGCAAHHERGLWCWGGDAVLDEPIPPGLTRVDMLADVPVGLQLAAMDVGYGGIGYTPHGERVYWPSLLRSWEQYPADAVAEVHSDGCSITTRGRLVCGPGMFGPVDGYQSVAMSQLRRYCGLRDDAGVDCWAQDGVPITWPVCEGMDVATTRFRAIGVYISYFAGITLDGAIVYAGLQCYHAPSVIPDGDWVQIIVGEAGRVCVRSEQGEIACDIAGRLEPGPPGPFVAMAHEYGTTCGMRPEGDVECWGFNQYGRGTPTPPP